jgi:cell division GTPase FtsZ
MNTAAQDMKSLKMAKNNQLVLDGYNGAGKNPKVGYEAAKSNYENILRKMHECFGKKVEHIMVCVGGGGGTGTGSAEVLVDVAHDYFKEHGIDGKVGVMVTTPDKTEKGATQKNAAVVIDRLVSKVEKKLSPLIIVDNGQIGKFFPNESIANFYPKSNQIVCGIFDRFNVITAYGSPIGYNVDGADYKALLDGGIMTYGQCKVKEIKSDTTLAEAMVKNVKNTLLCPGFDLTSATNACCLIMASEEELNKITKDAVNKAVESLSRVFSNRDVKIHLGLYKSPGKGVSIVTAVSGLTPPKDKLDQMKNS